MKLNPFKLTLCSLVLAAPILASGDPEAWKSTIPDQPAAVVVRHATIWTSGPQGTIEDGDILIQKGKIVTLGKGLAAPAGAVEIDGTGKHVTPGLIDEHSHAAIVGDVNEGTHIVTAEVRIHDVVNSESINLYRELAGGLTTANLLHGSANSIGGQNQVIKLRWGADPDGLMFAGAPEGIKFALGENPKQSNWGVERKRYPQTRMGVEQSIRERFLAALDYKRTWDEYNKSGSQKTSDRVPPRRDLQLDAIVEILEGKRLVHSHSYRADEILMLIHLADEFGFKVASFQHVLEGYKVADELAKHGAGASTFSDWWAYKFEVIDAIPYNGSLMTQRGVNVSFNSDDSELARRLNTEAAKAVRYGGLSEVDALKLVTINPAIQLHIQGQVGSLEPGKDADFVIWNGHPLSNYTRADQTWIDGRKYFDRADDLAQRDQLVAERKALLAKSKASNKEKDKDKKSDGAEAKKPEYLLWSDNEDTTCRTESGRNAHGIDGLDTQEVWQ
ncbi:MAG: amidohydrolase [Acidobacteriota bacterium]